MRVVLLAVVALVLAAPALGSNAHPTQSELETELVCPVCHETLDESTAPVAQDMKALIRKRIAQGWTKQQILDEMVANFGPGVLSTPATHGFDLIAWVLPLGGILLGATALGFGALRWRAVRATASEDRAQSAGLTPEDERRVDEELNRFDD